MKTALIPALEDVRHRASRLDLESDRNDIPDDAAPAAASLPLDGDESGSGKREDGPAPHAGREDADILKEIARQIREGALSARPTRNTVSGSAAKRVGCRYEWRLAGQWIGIACTPLSAPGFPGARSRPFRQARARTQDTVDCNRRRCRDHARRASRRNGQRAISQLRRRYSRKRHARSRCDHVAAIGKRQAETRAISRPIALDLNAIVERTVSSVQALAELRGLALVFDAGDSRPHIVANPTAMRQILLNLLTNAIKFTPRGGDVRVATGYIGTAASFSSFATRVAA